MGKLSALYRLWERERNQVFSEIPSRKEFQALLQSKLDEEDYQKADELLNELEHAIEERGFKEGVKFCFELLAEINHI